MTAARPLPRVKDGPRSGGCSALGQPLCTGTACSTARGPLWHGSDHSGTVSASYRWNRSDFLPGGRRCGRLRLSHRRRPSRPLPCTYVPVGHWSVTRRACKGSWARTGGTRGGENASLEGSAGRTRSAGRGVRRAIAAARRPERARCRRSRRTDRVRADVLGPVSERRAARAQGGGCRARRDHRDQSRPSGDDVGAGRAGLEPVGDASRHDDGGFAHRQGAGRAGGRGYGGFGRGVVVRAVRVRAFGRGVGGAGGGGRADAVDAVEAGW